MKVSEKLTRAKEAIRFIAMHDDAPAEEVESALDELTEFIRTEKQTSQERRATKLEEET